VTVLFLASCIDLALCVFKVLTRQVYVQVAQIEEEVAETEEEVVTETDEEMVER
jgi:hypothetical protein